MKRYVTLLVAVTLSACNLLDVSPRQEMRQSDLFSREDGFKEALTGVYIRMAGAELWGANTSFYMPEVLAHTFTVGNRERFSDVALSEWNFADPEVEKLTTQVWNTAYNGIAELNNILDNIDARRDIFRNGNYELIKGEALGLRAFLHLELLRLYGPLPMTAADVDDAIPYAEKFSRNPADYVSRNYGTVKSCIVRDLDEAEKLLDKDPLRIATLRQTQFDSEPWPARPVDGWQSRRQQRFNYFAVAATRARFYHWVGMRAEAVQAAEEVISARKFRLTAAADFTPRTTNVGEVSLVFFNEQILAVDNPGHAKVIEPFFVSGTNRLTQKVADINKAYENNTTDIRNVPNRFWHERYDAGFGTANHYQKYSGNADIAAANKVPLLRLSELYLIAIENLPAGDPRVEAYFKELVDARGMSQQLLGTLVSEQAVLERMEKEWRKEFMGEGQMFFFYKKHGITHFTWPVAFDVPAAHANMSIPKPKGQIAFE